MPEAMPNVDAKAQAKAAADMRDGTKAESRMDLRKVLILTADSPEQLGGVGHFVRQLQGCLGGRGYKVEVLHRENSCPRWLRRTRSRYWNYLEDFLVGYFIGRSANRNLRGARPGSVAVISNGPVGWYPMRRHAGQIHIYHGTYRGGAEAVRHTITTLGYWKLKYWDAGVLERFSGRGKVCLSVSNQVAEEVSRYFNYRSDVCWLPLDVNHFRPLGEQGKWRQHWGLPEAGPVGLFVGYVSPHKGFNVAWELARQDTAISWLVVLRGDIPPGTHPANCRILQNVPHADLPGIYAASDFVVSPSLYDAFGYVVAEALACGVPVIASPGGASRLLLSEPPLDALMVRDARDVAGFCAAIERVLANRGIYQEAVLHRARPRIEELMAPENWWRRFQESTRL